MLKKIYRSLARLIEIIKISIVLLGMWPFSAWLKFWLTGKNETAVSLDGIKVAIRTKSFFSKTADIAMAYECILRDDYGLKNSGIQKDQVIIDIGGHIGSFSLAAAKNFPNAKIFSFEPSPGNYFSFKENIALNNFKNIRLFNKAVTSHGKKISIFIDPVNSAANSIYKEKGNNIGIPSVTLQEILIKNKIKKCNFMKIDCEGAEYEILLNTKPEHLRKIEKIAIEYHDPKHFHIREKRYNLHNLINHLKKSGFECKVNPMRDYQGVLVAERKAGA